VDSLTSLLLNVISTQNFYILIIPHNLLVNDCHCGTFTLLVFALKFFGSVAMVFNQAVATGHLVFALASRKKAAIL